MRKGFTLIELVLVIAIMGVLAVATSVIVNDYKKSYINLASKKVMSDIQHARGLAMMKKGTTFGVYFDQGNNRYTVYEGTVSTPVADPQTKQNLIETFSKWPGVSITGGNYTVEFNSVGAPTTGGGGGVSVTDGTTTKTITVTVVTGKVNVQ
jgi:prepilin-type N-terminal cleavage/methylation domain-containing protein